MNRLSPKKLLHSKWTSTQPQNKEKHFIISEVEFDEDGNVIECLIEAVINKRSYSINWRDLRDKERWLVGWR